jgi:hypothetical protein
VCENNNISKPQEQINYKKREWEMSCKFSSVATKDIIGGVEVLTSDSPLLHTENV